MNTLRPQDLTPPGTGTAPSFLIPGRECHLARRIDKLFPSTFGLSGPLVGTGTGTGVGIDLYSYTCSAETFDHFFNAWQLEGGTGTGGFFTGTGSGAQNCRPITTSLLRENSRYLDEVLFFDPDVGTYVPRFLFGYAHDYLWRCRQNLPNPGNPPEEPAESSDCARLRYMARWVGVDRIGTGQLLDIFAIAPCKGCVDFCCRSVEAKFPTTFTVTFTYVSGGTACGASVSVVLTLDETCIICNAPRITCPSVGASWRGDNGLWHVRLRCDYSSGNWLLLAEIRASGFDPATWDGAGCGPSFVPLETTADIVSCNPFYLHFPAPLPQAQDTSCYSALTTGTGSGTGIITNPGIYFAEVNG